MAVATRTAIEHGLWLRPFGKLVYAMPPFICTAEEVAQIGAGMVAVARALT
jgi:adenosylmethionine---8-amino-7-oxononanoate aminotransferase